MCGGGRGHLLCVGGRGHLLCVWGRGDLLCVGGEGKSKMCVRGGFGETATGGLHITRAVVCMCAL